MDILFKKRDGRFSGEAYVVLPGMMQVDFALGKHKAYLGRRYVEVQSAQREVWTPQLLMSIHTRQLVRSRAAIP